MDNRTRILNHALHLFAAHGYDAVGVQQIAQAAEITKPTLYHYFGSKHGLLETLLKEKSAPLLTIVEAATDYQHDITYSIKQVIHAYFDYADEQPTFYRMMLAMWFAPPSSEYFPLISELQRKQYQLIETMFMKASEDHGNMQGRHQQYAISLKGTIDTYVGMMLQGFITVNDAYQIHLIAHQFMHGIFS